MALPKALPIALCSLLLACGQAPPSGGGADAAVSDFIDSGHVTDASPPPSDAAPLDASQADASPPGEGTADASPADAAPSDAEPPDAAPPDAEPPDAAVPLPQERLLYLADQEENQRFELYLVTSDGLAVQRQKVNGPIGSDRRVRDYVVSPDSSNVAYIENGTISGTRGEAFVVDLSGTTPGAAVRLHGDLPEVQGGSDQGIIRAEWLPSGDGLILHAALLPNGANELFLVRIGPTGPEAPIRLSATFLPDSGVKDFAIAPDGSKLVYRGDQETHAIDQLYLVRLDGSSPSLPTRISLPVAADEGDVDVVERNILSTGYDFSPDSSALFYLADHELENQDELYLVRFAQGEPQTPQKINGPPGDGWSIEHAFWSPTSSHIAYVAHEEGEPAAQLHVAAIGATGPEPSTSKSVGLYQNGAVVSASLRWRPDGSGIAFHAIELNVVGPPTELFYADIAGSQPTLRLNAPLTGSLEVLPGGLDHHTMWWSTDSNRLFFVGELNVETAAELYVVAFSEDGVTLPQNLTGPPPFAASDVTSHQLDLSPIGDLLAFSGNRLSSSTELFGISLANGQFGVPFRINAPMAPSGSLFANDTRRDFVHFSPSGNQIAYQASAFSDAVALYIVDLRSPEIALEATDSFPTGGDVIHSRWLQ